MPNSFVVTSISSLQRIRDRRSWVGRTALVCALVLMLVSGLWAGSIEKVRYNFAGGSDGNNPWGGLVFRAGSLYGTTLGGGIYGYGTAFQLTKSTHTVLHNFTGFGDGSTLEGTLIFDAAGNCYGTSPNGGNYGHGAIFELSGPFGGNWVLTPIYSFTGGIDGGWPNPTLIFDKAGNLYGTTLQGGASGAGTVFQLKPAGSIWTQQVLHSFSGSDGFGPWAGVVLHGGHLYGTTYGGGPSGYGTIFELTPSQGLWIETVLLTFSGGLDGGVPRAGVTFKGETIYGTTYMGGTFNKGTAFELSPKGVHTVLHNFGGPGDGALPESAVIFDKLGNLYGTTTNGGASDAGTVYELTPAPNGWTENLLYTFRNGLDGGYPVYGSLIFGGEKLYGTAAGGGTSGAGVVFEITP